MSEEYFNLTQPPFRLNTDTAFYFNSDRHRKALSYLQYGIQQGEGVVVITGMSGVGKSMLIEQLLSQVEGTGVLPAVIQTGIISQADVLSYVLSAFGIEARKPGKASQAEALREFLGDQLEAQRHPLLIVDEAQSLSLEVLDELRQLSNYSYNGRPLLQIFLLGQPELKEKLSESNLQQLKQRVIASCELKPLNAEETIDYIEHRMTISGWKEEESVFTDVAHQEIFNFTQGVPRTVNLLCTRLLLQAKLDKSEYINADLVREVVAELRSEEEELAAGEASDLGHEAVSEDIPTMENVLPLRGEKPNVEAPQPDLRAVEAAIYADVYHEQSEVTEQHYPASALENVQRTATVKTELEPEAERVVSATPASLDQLAHQLKTQLETTPEEQPTFEVQTATSGLEGLKNDMQDFVNEVQEGLATVGESMKLLRDRLSEMEQHRADRNTLIAYHLQEIDDILTELNVEDDA